MKKLSMIETIKEAIAFGEKSMLTSILIDGLKYVQEDPTISGLDLLNKLKNIQDEKN